MSEGSVDDPDSFLSDFYFSVPLSCPYTVKIKNAVFEIMYLVARKVSKRRWEEPRKSAQIYTNEMVWKVVSLGLSQ